jgi:dTDP-glucose pyrophosphorylase
MSYREYLVSSGTPVSLALRQVTGLATRHLFVVDDHGAPLGTLAEDVLREWVTAGEDPGAVVDRLMGPAPQPISRADSVETARLRIVGTGAPGVPVVDEYGATVDIVWVDDLARGGRQAAGASARMALKDVTVVVMAGGLGSRLAPFSTILPKPLMPVGDMTAIERVMETFTRVGCSRFIVSLGHKAELIRAYFRDVEPAYSVEFVSEDRPLGTAGALGLMRRMIEGPIFVTNCDVLIKADPAEILAAHTSGGRTATIVAALEVHEVPYGVLRLAPDGNVSEVSEKPRMEFLVSTGVYVLDPSVLGLVEPGEPEDMTSLLLRARALGPVGVYPIGGDEWLDIGRLDSLQAMAASVYEGWS